MFIAPWSGILFSFSLLFLFLSLIVKKPKYKREFFPPVSVISWFWKDGNIVERKIKNFLSLNYPGKFEIIIIDNASDDETCNICTKYAKMGKIKYFRVVKPYDRKAYALDEAIKKVAKYNILAMTDPDGICEKDWLAKIVQPFKDEKVGAVIGLTHCGNFYKNFFTKMRAVEDEWFYVISPLGRQSKVDVNLVCGANYAVRREALRKVNYHGKKTLAEDFELTIKLHNKGYDVKVTDASVWQEEVESLGEYIRQRLRWQGASVEGFWNYAREILRIFKLKPSGWFFFNLSYAISLFSLIYLLLAAYGWFFSFRALVFSILGWLVLNLSITVGLKKVSRSDLIKYVPFYLLVEPLLSTFIFAIVIGLKLVGKKILWRSLHDKYYHSGTRIVMK